MGVTTTADNNLSDAKDSIKRAIKALEPIVTNSCWGSDEFKDEYFKNIRKTYFKLQKLYLKL